MRKIFLLALNDLRLTVRDRASFIWMLLLPLGMMWIFGNIGNDRGGNAVASLSVVDHDRGWLARAFVDELGGDESFRITELTADEAATAEDKVRTLHIPLGFTEGVLDGEQQTLRLEKEPDTSADFALAAEVRIIRIGIRTVARLIEMNQAGELSGDATADGDRPDDAIAARFVELGEREPLVALDVTTAGEGRPVPGGRAQSVPGMLAMSVMMMTLIYGAVFLTTEKQSGTLRRQMTLPVGRGHVFAGKFAGRFALAALQTILLLLAGQFVYGLSYGNSFAGLVLLAGSYCFAVAGLATMLGALLRTPEQAGSIGWLLGMLLAATGGCWWPAEIMPRWMWQAAHFQPVAWAMDGFHALISFGYGLNGVLVPSMMLLGFGTLFAIVGARFLSTAGAGA